MAETIDLNRSSSGVNLTPEQAGEIWQSAEKQSAVMQLAQTVQLPGSGVAYDTLGDAEPAAWVGETAAKPVVNPTVGNRVMKPFKLARIITVSMEFARDKAALWAAIQAQASQSISRAIDETILSGISAAPSAENFDVLYDAPAISLGKSAYADMVKAYQSIADHGGELSGWALSPQGVSKFVAATDTNGRPLVTPDVTTSTIGNVLGAPVVKSPWGHKAATTGDPATPELLGIAGDWSQALFGTVQGIQLAASDTASVTIGGTLTSAWEHNLLAFRVEAEVGFIVKDKNKFAAVTA